MYFGWLLIGALIGALVAERNGFNMAICILGGMLLGPLALLMFFTTGPTKAPANVKCPHCAESIKPEAKVCRYCGRDVVPTT